jgi:hypothetical protein
MSNTDRNKNQGESRMVIHWAEIKQYAAKQSKNTQHKTEN